MARRKQGRPLNAVFILDKPYGLSSNAALQRTRRLFNAQKAGHTGSLDPMATGVLPICFGESTKFTQWGLDADKEYIARVRLGVTTRTGMPRAKSWVAQMPAILVRGMLKKSWINSVD
ncbi:MAG: tRNA pseudouridine(55) synthase TruB, partial [Pseudomonadales bacterium]